MDNSKNVWKKLVEILNESLYTLESFDFIKIDSMVPLSPSDKHYPFLFVDNNLGIPYCKLGQLFKESTDMIKTNNNTDSNNENVINLINATLVITLINPEHYTSWNIRRRLVDTLKLDQKGELLYTKLLLKKHPKRACIWSYRYWILLKFNNMVVVPVVVNDPKEELAISDIGCNGYKCNYHAFTHKRRILQLHPELIKDEFDQCRIWTRKHLSDSSGWCFRGWLLKKMVLDSTTTTTTSIKVKLILDEEVDIVLDLIEKFPGHESLWYYIRAIITTTNDFHLKSNSSSSSSSSSTLERLFNTLVEKESDQQQQQDLQYYKNFCNWLKIMKIKQI